MTNFLIRQWVCSLVVSLFLGSSLPAQNQPDSVEVLLKQAETLHRAGKLDEAIKDYRLFLAHHPDVAPVRSDLGAALAAAGRYEEAIAEYKRALQLQPLPQIRLNLALAYYKANKLTLAVDELQKVRREMPGDLRVVMLLADCDLLLGENQKVIALLDPLEATHGDDLAITYLLGTALVRDRQVARGQVMIDKILKNGDSAEARLLVGTTKLLMNDATGAVTDLQKAVELDPTLPSAHSYYGRALQKAGNPDEAEKAFRAELVIDPNDFDANLYLGALLKEEHEYQEALPLFRHALEVRPGDAGARYQIASVYLAERKFDDAQRELESLVRASPISSRRMSRWRLSTTE